MNSHSEPSKNVPDNLSEYGERMMRKYSMEMNDPSKEETPVRSAEEILKEKLKNIHFIRSDETYALVIEAMKEFAAQFKREKEEQRFTIEDMREAFDASWTTYCPFDEWIKTRKQ